MSEPVNWILRTRSSLSISWAIGCATPLTTFMTPGGARIDECLCVGERRARCVLARAYNHGAACARADETALLTLYTGKFHAAMTPMDAEGLVCHVDTTCRGVLLE